MNVLAYRKKASGWAMQSANISSSERFSRMNVGSTTCNIQQGHHVTSTFVRANVNSLLHSRNKDEDTRKILQMTVDGKRNRGRPKLRWGDLVRDDMARNQMTTEMAEDRGYWHVMIQASSIRSVQADR